MLLYCKLYGAFITEVPVHSLEKGEQTEVTTHFLEVARSPAATPVKGPQQSPLFGPAKPYTSNNYGGTLLGRPMLGSSPNAHPKGVDLPLRGVTATL